MLEIKNLNVTYDQSTVALEDVSMSLPLNRIYGIIGPNGAGKSTFIKAMLNLIPHRGEVLFNGQALKHHAKRISYVEQRSSIDMDFPMSVFKCVLTGTYPGLGLFKRAGQKEKERAERALKEVNMWDFRDRQIAQLSGGQFQRILIARAIAQEADLIFLDEPFVGVDVTSESIIVGILHELADNGVTIFIVHHDMSKVKKYFNGLILLKKKLIASGTVEEVFTKENLSEAYGENMFMFAEGGQKDDQ